MEQDVNAAELFVLLQMEILKLLNNHVRKRLTFIKEKKDFSIFEERENKFFTFLDEIMIDFGKCLSIIQEEIEGEHSATFESLKWKYRHLLPFPIPERIPDEPIEE
jgi:hypothetical protein